MVTIIAGSRTLGFKEVQEGMLKCPWKPTKIISGGARGVDNGGETWGREHNIPVEVVPPEWGKFGRSAGYKRNEKMAGMAEALVAVWDGKSRGTMHMIECAERRGLRVFIHTCH